MQSSTSSSRFPSRDFVTEFGNVTREGTQQLANAMRASQPLLDAYVGLLRAAVALPMLAMSSVSSLRRPVMASVMPGSCCDCEIPETDCPPYCVCEIAWEAAPGDKLKATIQLTNTRQAPQAFAFTAGSFQGPNGNTGAAVALAPTGINLAAGQSTPVGVTFEVPATFIGGSVYDSEIKITGLYDQCVKVTLRVRPTAPDPHCDVKQGDIPSRIRAHRWYQHFQCEEPCFEPARKPDQPPTAAGMVPHSHG